MSVNQLENVITVLSDSNVDYIPIHFQFPKVSDINVYVDDAPYNAEHYEVVKRGIGGYVKFKTIPDNGKTIRIFRKLTITQLVNILSTGSFPAQLFEKALDLLTMISQDNNEQGLGTDELLDDFNYVGLSADVYRKERNLNLFIRGDKNTRAGKVLYFDKTGRRVGLLNPENLYIYTTVMVVTAVKVANKISNISSNISIAVLNTASIDDIRGDHTRVEVKIKNLDTGQEFLSSEEVKLNLFTGEIFTFRTSTDGTEGVQNMKGTIKYFSKAQERLNNEQIPSVGDDTLEYNKTINFSFSFINKI